MPRPRLFTCASCGFTAIVAGELSGEKLNCEKCGERGRVPKLLPTLRREAREEARRKRKDDRRSVVPLPAVLAATAISAAAGYAWYELEFQEMGGHTWLAILTGVAIGAALGRLGALAGSAWWIAILLTVAPFITAKYQLADGDRMGDVSRQLGAMFESGALERMYRSDNGLSEDPPAAIPEDDFSKWYRQYAEALRASYPKHKLLLERLGPGEVGLLLISAGAALFALRQLERTRGGR